MKAYYVLQKRLLVYPVIIKINPVRAQKVSKIQVGVMSLNLKTQSLKFIGTSENCRSSDCQVIMAFTRISNLNGIFGIVT